MSCASIRLPRRACVLAIFAGALLMGRAQPEADALFVNPAVLRIQITTPAENIASLRARPRQYVRAQLSEGTNHWESVGIHLKGAVGSFRGIDGKPSFTISLDRFDSSQRFRGLRKIHLNNSVEDGSYLHELIGSDLFNAAKVPAPRVSHAFVELNGRRLGLYVLKEAFTEPFLARYFRNPKGNFYDIAVGGHDVNESMEKDFGDGPDDRSDLATATAAVFEPDLAKRWQLLQRTVDIDRFLSFMALEILLAHRDGYCLARNNFRIYHDVDANRLVFLPSGMDNLFGNPRAVIEPRMSGVVAAGLMEIPEVRRLYRERCASLRTNVMDWAAIERRIDAAAPVLRAALPSNEAAALDREVASLRTRIQARFAEVDKQLTEEPLELLRFKDGTALLTGWRPVDVPEGGAMMRLNLENRDAMTIRAGNVTSASWRKTVLLPPGRYRFEAEARTTNVKPLAFGRNHGAALRVIGVTGKRSAALAGTQPWTRLSTEFETSAREQEVEIVCELRASGGMANFDAASLRLQRIP